MLLTLQALWILLFSFVGRTFLIKSSYDTFNLIKDQVRSSRHSSKDPCISFFPYLIHCSCETQFTRKIDETLAMPSDSGPSNQFILAFCHSWNVASVTNIPPDHFRIEAFKEQVVVIFIVAET